MPVTVVVRSAGPGTGEAPSLTFDGPRIVLGRGQGSDVRLPDPSISTRHATIRAQGTEYAIVDEGSTNGTWIGGVRLLPQSPRLVKSGDLVRVGRVWLELTVGQRAPTPDLGLATRELALALVRRAMDAEGDDTAARVRVAEGPDVGTDLRLVEDGRAYIIGRADRCDLPLADADASREHAMIVRRGGSVLLRDMGSRNGVFLGEQRLPEDRDVPWRPPTMIRIGATVLALDEPVSLALADLESAEDERMPEDDVLPPPPSASAAPAKPGAEPEPPAAVEEAAASRRSVPRDAPIAEIAPPSSPEPPRRARGWTVMDVLVVTLAVAVISASIAGLVWVLR